MPLYTFVSYQDTNISSTIERLWLLWVEPNTQICSLEEIECEEHFLKTIERDASGRFKVRLSLKILRENLGDSKTQALKRFYALERLLTKNEPLRLAYITGLNDSINQGHIKRVTDDSSFLTYYIPHHTVIKEHSTSTKFRIVFDASMSTQACR